MNKGNELFHTHTYLFIHVAGDAQGRRSTPTSSGTSEMKVLFRTSGLRMFDPNGRSRPLVGPDDRLALIEAAVLENGECWAFALCLRCWWTTSWNSSGTTSWNSSGTAQELYEEARRGIETWEIYEAAQDSEAWPAHPARWPLRPYRKPWATSSRPMSTEATYGRRAVACVVGGGKGCTYLITL